MEPEGVPNPLSRAKLRIQWETNGDHPATQFAMALASLLSDCTDEIRVTGWSDTEFADLELDECAALKGTST